MNNSLGKTMFLGVQHVLAMYAGAIIVPLIVGSALKLNSEQMAYIIVPTCLLPASPPFSRHGEIRLLVLDFRLCWDALLQQSFQ